MRCGNRAKSAPLVTAEICDGARTVLAETTTHSTCAVARARVRARTHDRDGGVDGSDAHNGGGGDGSDGGVGVGGGGAVTRQKESKRSRALQDSRSS